MMSVIRVGLCSAIAIIATPRIADASCTIPGFTNAAFADLSFNSSGTTDSWDSNSGAYGPGNKCTDPVSCNDSNNCKAGVGTNASSISTPTTSGSCTTNANVTLPIPSTAGVTIPAANVLGAINGSKTITGPGNFSATSITENGNVSLDFKTATPNGAVVLYVSGSITIGGQGKLNNDSLNPSKVLIMCTGPAGQSVSLNGNGAAYFALYCPQADITLNGGGNGGVIYGAIVGRKITGNGNHAMDIHYDKQVANLTTDGISCSGETSRAAPVISSLVPSYGGSAVTALVQGSFEAPGTQLSITSSAASGAGTVAAWAFPYIKGHVRARLTSSISSTASSITGNTVCTSANTPSGCNTLFDASTLIPAAATSCTSPDGSCRYVFTNTNSTGTAGVSFHPTTQQLLLNDTDTTRVNAIGGLIASTSQVSGIGNSQWKTIINMILQSRAGGSSSVLGGVDRSGVAVVGPSPNGAGTANRAKMVYWGGTDGMLHAACAEKPTSGTCSGVSPGTELWAFIPRVQLPLIRTNNQRIDGSIRVIDAYGDFTNNPATGAKSWKTILVFQTGFKDGPNGVTATPGVYALDVTTPSSPTLLWEVVTPSTVGSIELGAGLRVTAGATRIAGSYTNVAVVETNNGGTGGAGVVVKALSLETGAPLWTFSSLYPTSLSPSSTGVPGGAVGVDVLSTGEFSDFVFADLYGRLWMVNAQTGVSRTGPTTPLFAFSQSISNKRPIGQPPAIYSNGSSQYAVVSSGGYVDHTDTGGNGLWSTGTQYVVGVKLDQKATSSSSETTTTSANGAVSFTTSFTGFGFGQAVVVGTQLFVTFDSADANSSTYAGSTGTLKTYALGTTSTAPSLSSTTTLIASAATSLASSGTEIFSSGGQKQQQMSSATTTTGNKVDLSTITKIARNLWLRGE